MGIRIRQSVLFQSIQSLLLTGIAVTGLSACSAPGSPTSSQPHWQAIPVDEASLVLYAPGLGSPRVTFERMIDGLQILERGHWRPANRGFPEAKLVLFRFSPVAPAGMTFVREPDLEERIRRWFGGQSIEMGARGNYRNVLGGVEYMHFAREGAFQCVFMRQFGDTYSDQRDYFSDGTTGHGDIMIRGYYCLAPFQELSRRTAQRFLAGIGLKGFGVPTKPLDLSLPVAPIAATAGDRRQPTPVQSGTGETSLDDAWAMRKQSGPTGTGEQSGGRA